MGNKRTKKSISLEGFVFLAIFLGIFGGKIGRAHV